MVTRKAADKFPLWLHPRGLWCKKHRGQFHYFGADKETALKRFVAEWDDIKAGRTPRPQRGTLPLADLVNDFLTWKREKVQAGELSPRSWEDYHLACEKVIDCFGRQRTVEDLRPDDFGKLRAIVAKRLGPAALLRFVTLTKSLFSFAFKSELIDVPVRFGNLFDKPPKRLLRKKREQKGEQLVSAADFWKLHDAADVQVRAMLLLGMNAGYGAKDCADLPRSALKDEWIVFARPKSGIGRRCPLWPETVAALQEVHAVRPDPNNTADADCVFLTMFGNRWCRHVDHGEDKRGLNLDAVAQAFRKLCKAAGVTVPGGPYTLRRTFRTIADGAKDEPAIDLIMGHASDNTMGGLYRQNIADSRLVAVVSHVREWLLTGRGDRSRY